MLLTPDQARCLIEFATESRFALLAINADSPAAVADGLEAAKLQGAPLIVETSLWQLTGHSFGLGNPILGLARYLSDLAILAQSPTYRDTPVIFHTDHIKGPQTKDILEAALVGIPVELGGTTIQLRASSLSLDSSELTANENIDLMSSLCLLAEKENQKGTLEMEAGIDQGVSPLDDTRAVFGVVEDRHPGHLALWAPGVGTEHGLGSGNTVDTDAIRSHQALASEICQRPIGLALHGSSGLSEAALQGAVAAGTAKVNWSSESLLIRSQAAQEYYRTHGTALQKGQPDFKIRAMDNGVQSFVAERYIPLVRQRIDALGGTGQAAPFLTRISNTHTIKQ